MVPNLILEMTDLLVPFCAVALGFTVVGLGALMALAIEDVLRRKRAVPRVDLAGMATSSKSGRSATGARIAA